MTTDTPTALVIHPSATLTLTWGVPIVCLNCGTLLVVIADSHNDKTITRTCDHCGARRVLGPQNNGRNHTKD